MSSTEAISISRDCTGCMRRGACFVTRLKTNTSSYFMASRPVNETAGLRCDQTIRLNSTKGRAYYPEPLRRIRYLDPGTR